MALFHLEAIAPLRARPYKFIMQLSRLFFLICLTLLSSCYGNRIVGGERDDFSTLDAILDYYNNPQYGDQLEISGEFYSFFETSAINLCEDRNKCWMRRNVDGSVQTCWVEFADTPEIARALDDLEDGSYWIDGIGKIAVFPGSFGHMGGYTCQVEISELKEFTKEEDDEPLDPTLSAE